MFRTHSYFLSVQTQFVDQVTRMIFPWSIKAPCETDNFDQQISPDADGDESSCLRPYPIKAQKHVKSFTPDEIENCITHADITEQQLGIYSQ